MDGFKNTTKMKYMCGGPVRKAMGGAIKSVAPKGLLKSAAGAKIVAKASDLAKKAAPEMAKRQVQPTPPKDVVREAPRPTMEPKRSDEGISAKRRLAGTAGDYAAPPEKAKTMGGVPKGVKAGAAAAQTMGGASRDAKTPEYMDRYAKTIGGEPKTPKGGMTMGKSPLDGLTKSPMTGPLGSVAKNPPKGGAALSKMAQSAAKGISSVNTAKKGVPVASKKPMIGLKTGGSVTKSMCKW